MYVSKTSFWNFLDTFLGCFHTSFELLKFHCVCVSLCLALCPHWNLLITSYLQFWTRWLSEMFRRHAEMFAQFFQQLQIHSMSTSLFVSLLTYPSVNEAKTIRSYYYMSLFPDFLETFLGCLYVITDFLYVPQSVCCLNFLLKIGWNSVKSPFLFEVSF